MPRLVESGGDAITQGHGLLVSHRRKVGEGRLRILDGVQGDFRVGTFPLFSFVAPLFELSVLFLQAGGIEKDDLSNIGGGFGAVDVAAETLFDQLGDEAGVVEVGVGDQNGIDAVGWNRERLPVAAEVRALLIKAAIDQDSGLIGFEDVP